MERKELKALLGLHEAATVIFSELRLEQVIEVVLDIAMRTLKADDVCLMLYDDNGGLYVAGATGLREENKRGIRLAIGERVAGKVVMDRHPTVLNGPLDTDPRFSDLEGIEEIQSAVICPIVTKRKTWGVLCVSRVDISEIFTQTEHNLAVVFVSQIAEAIENAHLHEEMEGNFRLLQKAYQDLEKNKERLVQAEKLSAIGELVSGVAHELNNPLAAIKGLSDLFVRSENVKKMKDSLVRIKRNAERCHGIVQNLLKFARKSKPSKGMLDLNVVITESLELLEYELRSSSVVVEKQCARDLPLTIGDHQQLMQVFVNLINNARQSLLQKEGERDLRISTELENGAVLARISDTGIGIPREHKGRLFTPFFTTKKVGEGTGLGLSISYGIIQEHDGDISVESIPGEGATFTVRLPAAKGEQKEGAR